MLALDQVREGGCIFGGGDESRVQVRGIYAGTLDFRIDGGFGSYQVGILERGVDI